VCFSVVPKFGYLLKRLIIDQISRKQFFPKIVPVFEKTFQYLGGISQDISVSHFDSIAGDVPRRFFLSALLCLVISMTGRSKPSARALRDGADVVREAIGN